MHLDLHNHTHHSPDSQVPPALLVARALALARDRGVGQPGGSDSHFPDEVARAVTVIDAGMLRADDVVQILGAGRTSAQGRNRGAAGTGRYVTKAVGEWIVRGMRRI